MGSNLPMLGERERATDVSTRHEQERQRRRRERDRGRLVALATGCLLAHVAISCKKPDPEPVTPASASASASASPVRVAASASPDPSASASASASGDVPAPPSPGEDGRPPGFHAPVKLWLRGSGDGKNLALHVDVEVITAADFPSTLVVSVPPGATLAKGAASQTISLAQAGKQGLDFQITSPTPLSDAAPVRVTLDGKDPTGVSGFHAERRWPEKIAQPPPPRSGPTPPGGRPPPPMKKTKE